MGKDLIESINDLELEQRATEDAVVLERLYDLPADVARRIVEMSQTIDQAHAIAELMR